MSHGILAMRFLNLWWESWDDGLLLGVLKLWDLLTPVDLVLRLGEVGPSLVPLVFLLMLRPPWELGLRCKSMLPFVWTGTGHSMLFGDGVGVGDDADTVIPGGKTLQGKPVALGELTLTFSS